MLGSSAFIFTGHSMVYTISLLGFVILSSMEESGSFSWDDILSTGTFLLVIVLGTHAFYCFPADQRIDIA